MYQDPIALRILVHITLLQQHGNRWKSTRPVYFNVLRGNDAQRRASRTGAMLGLGPPGPAALAPGWYREWVWYDFIDLGRGRRRVMAPP